MGPDAAFKMFFLVDISESLLSAVMWSHSSHCYKPPTVAGEAPVSV
jgi:hypothetical protein